MRKRIGLAGVVAVACSALLVAAWLSAPQPNDLAARLAARERVTGVATSVPLARISPFVREALVATEDERFFHNHGIDLIGIARALPYDASHLSFAEGASTITDQLAKLLYLQGNDHSPWRKLEDLMISLRLSTRYSKEQVLDAYLNTAYFGHGAYGIGAASKRYFGVEPSKLNLAQAALVAGLVQAPSAYDPFVHPLKSRQRQVIVLDSLVRDGYVTSRQAALVIATPLLLGGTTTLAPLRGVTFASQAAFAWGGLALGVVILVGALAAIPLVRRRRSTPEALSVAVRVAATAGVVLGCVLITGSFRAL